MHDAGDSVPCTPILPYMLLKLMATQKPFDGPEQE